MSTKFFDLEPANDGSHYVCENGRQIARFNSLATAETVRDQFMAAEAARLQTGIEELSR